MSYLPRAPTQGAAVPVRRDVTTPLPRTRADEERNLAYKVRFQPVDPGMDAIL